MSVVADTGGLIALLDRDDRHHRSVRHFFEKSPTWLVPWAVLPEVDYLAHKRLGPAVAEAFLNDIRAGVFLADEGLHQDLPAAHQWRVRFADLQLGLVDSIVLAQAQRHQATALVTTDVRHMRPTTVTLRPVPRLVPLA